MKDGFVSYVRFPPGVTLWEKKVSTEADYEHADFDFADLEPVRLSIKIGKKPFVLCEADGDAGAKYRSAAARSARLNDGKVIGVEGIGDIEPLLVSRCLYYADEQGRLRVDDDDKPVRKYLVEEGTIRSWPDRVQKALFNKVKEISGLDETDTIEKIEKQIANLQKKRAKLLADKKSEEKDDEVSVPKAMQGTTDSGSD